MIDIVSKKIEKPYVVYRKVERKEVLTLQNFNKDLDSFADLLYEMNPENDYRDFINYFRPQLDAIRSIRDASKFLQYNRFYCDTFTCRLNFITNYIFHGIKNFKLVLYTHARDPFDFTIRCCTHINFNLNFTPDQVCWTEIESISNERNSTLSFLMPEAERALLSSIDMGDTRNRAAFNSIDNGIKRERAGEIMINVYCGWLKGNADAVEDNKGKTYHEGMHHMKYHPFHEREDVQEALKDIILHSDIHLG